MTEGAQSSHASDDEAKQQTITLGSLERILNAIPDPVFVKDEQHRWVYLNDAYCQFMGYPREALLGKSDDDFFPPEQADVFWKMDEAAFASGAENVNEENFTDAAGFVHVISTKKSIYRDDEGRRYLVGVIRDITERKRMEEALRELDTLKSNFVGAVSHELRTPLTSIKGYAEFLEEGIAGPITPTQQEFVERIMEGAARLERLVDDLLDFARLESGTFKLVRRPMDLVAVLEEARRAFTPQAVEKQVELRIETDPREIPLEADPGRLEQVMTNLVGNALKFTPAGGRIHVSARADAQAVRVEVRDTGTGIAAEHLPHLFDRFYQADPGPTRKTGGTGLGLTISKALVEAHGGEIGVESTPGMGTTFWFALPRHSAPSHD